jgi:glycosyltransferase involved in cell wall biosynthesis
MRRISATLWKADNSEKMKSDEGTFLLREAPRLTLEPAVCLVVSGGEETGIERTLDNLVDQGISPASCQVLAADTPAIRHIAGHRKLDARFCLPEQLLPGCYWKTVLALGGYSGDPVIFLRAGCLVPEYWRERLAAAMQRTGMPLALSPMSAAHPLLKAFTEPNRSPGLDVSMVDQWLNDYAQGGEFDVPTVLESCAILSGAAWPDLLAAAEDDAALFEEARKRGHVLLGCDHLYVDDAAVPDLGASTQGLPEALCRSLAEANSRLSWRHALTELATRAEEPPRSVRCLPVQLHVGHSWGGGLGRWIEDYIAADTHHNNIVLRPLGDWNAFGKTIALYRGGEMDVPIRTWMLTVPIVSIAGSSRFYRDILKEVIAEFRVESLVISSLIGTSLDILKVGLPTTYVCHDFFPYCPALVATYESPCTSCDSEKHRRCQQDNPHHRFFLHDSWQYWDQMREQFTEVFQADHIHLVAPSQSVAERYRQLVPGCADRDISVIPHGLSPSLVQQLGAVREHAFKRSTRLKVVILGSLASHKGVTVLAEIMPRLTGFADLFLIGCGEEGRQFAGRDNVIVIPSYTRDELPVHLMNAQTDIGLLLSVVPETFSYTLSEFWAAGIPVVATNIGAFADRVQDGVNGWLVEPSPAAVFAKVQWLHESRDAIEQVRRQLIQAPVRSSGNMADDYEALSLTAAPPPLSRFLLGRRSYRNVYRDFEHQKALHINHQATYRQILLDFLHYSRQKALQTPQLKGWQRGFLSRLLGYAIKRLSRQS